MPSKTGSGVIVVVEDPCVRNFLRSVLERQGYEVLSGGVWHGLAALRDSSRKVQLLITNVPSAFTEFAGRVPLLYLAALPDPSLVLPYRNSRVLSKPFHPHHLLASVQELLRLLGQASAGPKASLRKARPGVLLIGDAAHVMSPVGGVGINYAVQDAVAASNLLGPKLKAGHVEPGDLEAVQRK